MYSVFSSTTWCGGRNNGTVIFWLSMTRVQIPSLLSLTEPQPRINDYRARWIELHRFYFLPPIVNFYIEKKY